LWEKLEAAIKTNFPAHYADEIEDISFEELLIRVKVVGKQLDNCNLVKKNICIIEKSRQFEAGICVLACLSKNIIPIILSNHYGKSKKVRCYKMFKPDLIIDDTQIVTFDEKQKESRENLQNIEIIMCTSGTSGVEKGAMFTGESIYFNIQEIQRYYKLEKRQKVLIARPLSHCAVMVGEFFLALNQGADLFFHDHKFLPMSIVKKIEEYKIDSIGLTPTLCFYMQRYYRLRNSISCLKKISLSGECFQKQLADDIKTVFPQAEVYHVYGLTEAGPRVSYLPPELFYKYPKSVGYPLQGTKIKILNQSQNGVGEIYVKSKSLMKGYFGDLKKLKEVEWLKTGDLGYFKDNRLYITCRQDDMLIKAGMNIYPTEIEELLNQMPEIKESYVYGIKGKTGDDIIAEIVLENSMVCESDIYRAIGKNMPQYLFPHKIKIVQELQKTGTGKIKRRHNNEDME